MQEYHLVEDDGVFLETVVAESSWWGGGMLLG
jgi:hypothetical protein